MFKFVLAAIVDQNYLKLFIRKIKNLLRLKVILIIWNDDYKLSADYEITFEIYF